MTSHNLPGKNHRPASSFSESLYTSSTHLTVVPTWRWLKTSWHYFIGFGCGAGLAKKAPGTWGSLAAIPLFWLSGLWILAGELQCMVLIGLFLYGCYAAQQCGNALGESDHKGIVIDEIWAMWALLCIFPLDFFTQGILFASFRLFDITKPFPIRYIESRYKNGFGVMIDDVLAAVYAAIATELLLASKMFLIG